MYPRPDFPAAVGTIIDSHAHYNDPRYDGFLDELFTDLKTMGVKKIINCGTDYPKMVECIELSKKYEFCFTAIGFHPSHIPENEEIDYGYMEELIKNNRIVAVGETGLDYCLSPDNKERQKAEFVNHINLAKKCGLPIIVHDRDAHADTLEILKEHKPSGVVHCFSGSAEMAAETIKLGMYIGIGGVLTFKNGRVLKEAAKIIPLDRILLETDAPYLSPEPFRGKLNHSALIIYVARALAEIKGISVEEVLRVTSENTERLFQL